MRLLVCGSREWPGTWEDINAHLPESAMGWTIIHGACSRIVRGAQVSVDMLADFATRGSGSIIEAYPVDHALDGPWPAAGPRRNARMLRDGKPTHGLAFGALMKPAGSTLMAGLKPTGTGNMVSLMLRAGLPVRWVPAPGAPAQDLTEMPAPPVAT